MKARLNWKLVSLAALVAGASAFAWMSRAGTKLPDTHREARQFTLYQTLSRTSDPVIVLGDSIVEASTLPRAACGRAIVNAGLNGASTASDLGGWLGAALDGKRAAAIVVALGVNDAIAAASQNPQQFAASYSALLSDLSKRTSRLAVLEIAPVEAQGRMTTAMRDELTQSIRTYNALLPDIAARHGASFVALLAMTAPYTVDGVHLNANGYRAWDQAVMQAAGAACG